VPAVIGLAFLALPLAGLLVRAPWSTLPQRLTEAGVLAALRLSLVTATLATAVSLLLGVPLAWLLARTTFPGRRFVRALVAVPLVLPPVVGGVALLLVFGRRGLLGGWLDATFGISLPFTTAGVVVAEAFVAMPVLVISVEGALRGADARYEEAAATLGASRWTAFRRVTLPLIAPGVAAGAVLCWARALGDPGRPARPVDLAVSLDARLVVRRPGFSLDAVLTAAPGEVVALLGPNGAGKTTTLRALAGLIALDDGHVVLNDRRLDDPAIGAFTTPEHRRIGVVFQDYLLFPHMSALENVAFGPRSRGVPRGEARATAARWLDRVGLAEHARKRPRQLSGGQAQRVALARALATDPQLLLLDEPLAALDARTRLDTRARLRGHLAGFPGATVLVTHDPLDAMMLADRLVIVEDGRVVQTGDAAAITTRPRTDYVARLVGLNLYRGRSSGSTVLLPGGFTLTTATPSDGDVCVAFPPSAVALYAERPSGSPRNTWPATVVSVARHGDSLRIELAGPIPVAADVTPAAAVQLELAVGREVWASLKANEATSYPAS
jgi:molybdate transport system ATP-binding protein